MDNGQTNLYPILETDSIASLQSQNLVFYFNAIRAGFVKTLPHQKTTKRRANCDVCLTEQAAGMNLYFLTGKGSHRFHVCASCKQDLPELENVIELVYAGNGTL